MKTVIEFIKNAVLNLEDFIVNAINFFKYSIKQAVHKEK